MIGNRVISAVCKLTLSSFFMELSKADYSSKNTPFSAVSRLFTDACILLPSFRTITRLVSCCLALIARLESFPSMSSFVARA